MRQGDILIETADALPRSAHEVAGSVLVHGYAPGHNHEIRPVGAAELFSHRAWPGGFIRVGDGGATMVHPEHKPIQLPPGVYRWWQQREYRGAGSDLVAD